jgi:UDP-N-acetylglucosamine 2-epimerase
VRILTVVGARPQFIKAAVVSRALKQAGVDELLLHTGQHYDDRLSDLFFRGLQLPDPHFHLGIGSGTHGTQTGRMLAEIERIIAEERPDRVLVYGDTNSTLAGALAAGKLQVAVDHVEAGLRSFDRDMPEELNRLITDHLSDQLFCPTRNAVDQLRREGIADGVLLTGDVMLDLSLDVREPAAAVALPDGLHAGRYFVATIHRPSNTDEPARLRAVMEAFGAVGRDVAPVVLPVHPRLRAALGEFEGADGTVRCVPPLGYLEMQGLLLHARGVLTDSGGLQKEAMFHGVPCITLRNTTEWPESVAAGLNVLADDLREVPARARECGGAREVPAALLDAFGGGQAGQRIAEAVLRAGASRRRWRHSSNVAQQS